jgi:hypothetical protein
LKPERTAAVVLATVRSVATLACSAVLSATVLAMVVAFCVAIWI